MASSSKKHKILVVDDEPDNLDLLYRTFHREFKVLKANDAHQALAILDTEGDITVIISDQRIKILKERLIPSRPITCLREVFYPTSFGILLKQR